MSALAATDAPTGEIKKYSSVCRSNCNFACRYLANVVDGKIIKLEVGDYDDPDYTGCCLKGLSYIERIYSPERIKYPLKRAGARGEDKWERISWDEALNEVVTKLTEVAEKYGPKSIIYDRCTGNYAALNGGTYGMHIRLGMSLGWCRPFINYDYATGSGLDRLYGTGEWYAINEIRSVYDAKICIMWGTNPVFTAPQAWRFIQFAHERGTKLICIDPIKSATAHRCDQYIATTPGNDGLMALAMCNWLIQEDLIDKDYLKDMSTQSFLVRRDTKKHLRLTNWPELQEGADAVFNTSANAGAQRAALESGTDGFYVWDLAVNAPVLIDDAVEPAIEGTFTTEDGVVVDTAWTLLKNQLAQYSLEEAERVCGVPVETMKNLALDFAKNGPVSTYITYGADHYVNGHLTCNAIGLLHALTGNYAKKGAGFLGVWVKGFPFNLASLWVTKYYKGSDLTLAQALIYKTIQTGELEGTPYPLKAIYSAGSNIISNMGEQNRFLKDVVPNLEFWVMIDLNMNDSARYADIILPCASWYEVDDIYSPYCHPYTVISEKAIDPLYESWSDVDIACELGRRFGMEDAFPKDYKFEDWLNILLDNDIARKWGLNYQTLKANKYIRTDSAPNHAFVRGIDEPIPTESGRIQLYWENPYPRIDFGQELPTYDEEHLSHYREGAECGPNNPLRKDYPLVFLQEHSRFRVHSQWWDVPMLRELDPEPLAKFNQVEADSRGIKDGDIVEVYSHRGHAVCKCLIDNSIAPGILSIPKGWQRSQVIDGCFQELTNGDMDPFPLTCGFYDSLCNVRKYEGSVK